MKPSRNERVAWRRVRTATRVGLLAALALAPSFAGDPARGASRIVEADVERHLRTLASPGMEGRDSPSEGLRRAAAYISERFAAAGLQPAPDPARNGPVTGAAAPPPDPSAASDPERYLWPFHLRLPAPTPEGCLLELETAEGVKTFALGTDYVPAPLCDGDAQGELVFAGFGIVSKKHHHDDLKKLRLEGKIAFVFDGEPRHRTKFDGPEITPEASLWTKLEALENERVAGVLVARRPPEGAEQDAANLLDFRHTYASFANESEPLPPKTRPPVLEISLECASALLGTDATQLAEKLDRTGKAGKVEGEGRTVRMRAATAQGEVRLDNVVGYLPGGDPKLAGECVVVGAHYDHVGVDPRGRVGAGADDNASGVAALLAVADALAEARPRRSVLFAAFCAEEDGLVGSKELCKRLPVDKARVVAMLNMDMVGRGRAEEVAVLGVERNPALEKVLERANDLSRTGVREIVLRQGEELWRRSDHHSFHELGIPVLFFFEGLPISRNPDYHTWRDVADQIDFDKVARTARLVFNTAWILAEDDERPPPPRD